MKIKPYWLFCVFCLGFLPVRTFAQCPDQHDRHCWNLQYMLYAAQTDFREFQPPEELSGLGLFPDSHRRVHTSSRPSPDASFADANVPCQISAWMNGVTMYLCQGQASAQAAEQWYAKTLTDLQQLQYLWQFKVAFRDTGHYVDAGPPGCEVAALDGPYIADGPYLGQCPLHLQAVRQPNGTAKIYFWLTSYTSSLLVAKADSPSRSVSQYLRASHSAPPAPPAPPPAPPAVAGSQTSMISGSPSAPVAPSPAAGATTPASSSGSSASSSSASLEPASSLSSGCGDLCQNLKKILENRSSAFRALNSPGAGNTHAASIAPDSSGVASSGQPIQLPGASGCSIKPLPSDPTSVASSAPLARVHLTPGTLQAKTGRSHTQYVCYWPEDSTPAAEARFRDLSALLGFVMPSTWSAHLETQTDELSGAKITVWSAHDAADRPAIGLYLSGQSVGLHVAAAN